MSDTVINVTHLGGVRIARADGREGGGNDVNESERAYRRGALQSVQFLKRHLDGASTLAEFVARLAEWEQRLIAGRGDQDVRLLGHYLDVLLDGRQGRTAGVAVAAKGEGNHGK